ncbi:MAG: hypothetical protein FJ387_18675 [Verrucomicrobia bacterium]|nr:hypothetical protein [Verrucomicrobiota bacterium]
MAVLIFLKEALTSFRRMGAFLPAQRHLIDAVVNALPRRNRLTIVELGAGEGCITRAVVRKLDGLEYQLLVFELSDALLEANRHALGVPSRRTHAQIHRGTLALLKQDAFRFPDVLAEHGVSHVDAVLSSLPLSHSPAARRRAFIESVRTTLADQGLFVQYRHTPRGAHELHDCFLDVQRRFVVNLMPAWVYTCRRPARAGAPARSENRAPPARTRPPAERALADQPQT